MRIFIIIVAVIQTSLTILAESDSSEISTAYIDRRISFENRDSRVDYVDWKEMKKGAWGEAGDGAELHFDLTPGEYQLSINLYDLFASAAAGEVENDKLHLWFNGKNIGTFTRGRYTGWRIWKTVIPKNAFASSFRQKIRFVRSGKKIPIREVRIVSHWQPQSKDPDCLGYSMLTEGMLRRNGWDAFIKQRFMHSPVFRFVPLENALSYRCTISSQSGGLYTPLVIESNIPEIDLADIWEKLPSVGGIHLSTEAIDAKGKFMGRVSFDFEKKASFTGSYRQAESDYLESGARAASWVMQTIEDVESATYPTLFGSAYMRVLSTYARLHPTKPDAKTALRTAMKCADQLIKGSTPSHWVYAGMPISHEKSRLQIGRAGMAGIAYLDLYSLTEDKDLLHAAMRIADTLKATQLKDGRWYFRVVPETGKVLIDYTSDQVEALLFLDELITRHHRIDLIQTRDKAVNWMLDNPCKTFTWQPQWDDVNHVEPYKNAEWYDTSLFIEYLLRNTTPQNNYEEVADSLFRYIEDQFVEWEPVDSITHGGVKVSADERYITPGVREQYGCYHVIDWHVAHYVRVCMAFHKYSKDEGYLNRAKAMADTLTAIQHPDGFYPTWMNHRPSLESPRKLRGINYDNTWSSCTSYTGEMLMKFGEYLSNYTDIKQEL